MPAIVIEYPDRPERVIVVQPERSDVIPVWRSGADETEAVSVIVRGPDLWSVKKAIELIQSAPEMYKALSAVLEFSQMPSDTDVEEIIAKVQRAIAHAKGGATQREYMQRSR